MAAVLLAYGRSLQAQGGDCRLLHKLEGKESAYPRLSRDEGSILYQSNKDGHWQLYLMELRSGRHTPVLASSSNDYFPDWSADNKWIAFVSDRDGNEELYLMRTGGSSLRRLTTDPSRDIHPYFSPDGRYLLFSSTRGNGSLDIFRYTIGNGKTDQLTDTKDEDETCARYSPDMKEIVFLRNNAAEDDVHILSIPGFLSRNITNTPSFRDGWPMYSADGSWIYYSSMEEGSYSIYRMKPDGSGKQKITTAESGEEDARVFVSRNGASIIYNKRIGSTIEIRGCRI